MFILPLCHYHLFSAWKSNTENECRKTKLRDPIWSRTTSLISCTSDLWEHSGSATLWQYRGIKQMKENSLARAEIRWAEGGKNNLKSNCVMPHGCKGVRRDIFSFLTSFSTVLPLHINFQPVPFFFLVHLLKKWHQRQMVTPPPPPKKIKNTLDLTRIIQHLHLRLCRLLDVVDTHRVIPCRSSIINMSYFISWPYTIYTIYLLR